jgi:hypothetical protein
MDMKMTFDCDRTCKRYQECKFSPVFLAIGRAYVHSHTTTVNVEFRDRQALYTALAELRANVIGDGRHALYSSNETGFAFQLPGWTYPIIAKKDGSLAFDTDNGRWGNESDIQTLTGAYAIEAARNAANAQGWVSQDQVDGSLLVYHPDGGTMTVKRDGTVDSNGFIGTSCDAAAVIESAIGATRETSHKAEYFAEHAKIQETE